MSLKTAFRPPEIDELRRFRQRAHLDPPALRPGWTAQAIDPKPLLRAFDPLYVRRGLRIRIDLEKTSHGVRTMSWAVPNSSPSTAAGAKPPDALDHTLDALDAEPGPWGYLCASILGRELSELGASGAYARWHKHELVDHDPYRDLPPNIRGACRRETFYAGDPPSDWRPTVIEDTNRVIVRFYTVRRPDGTVVYRHLDEYHAEGFDFTTTSSIVGRLPGEMA